MINSPKIPQDFPKPQYKFICEKCQTKTNNKKDYNNHLLTKKHNRLILAQNHECLCGKKYKHYQSLYKHKKNCTYEICKSSEICANKETQIINTDEILDYKGMFMTMINENKELRNIVINQQSQLGEQQSQLGEQQSQLGEQQKQISEMIPKLGNNTINNKQKYNINIFLNEKCKDAMTMNKFLDTIKVTIEDLMHTKNKGITEGISNLFIKNMNKLSLYERPIHCTDVKRETVYIKSEGKDGEADEWQKDKEQEQLKGAISNMTFVQSKNLKLYTDENPDWMEKEHKQNEYVKMMKNCMDNIKTDNRREKIIKKVCNNVYYNGSDD